MIISEIQIPTPKTMKLSKKERQKIQEKEWARLMKQIKIQANKANY